MGEQIETLDIETAGHTHEDLHINVGSCKCGNITDGVLFEHGDTGAWLIDYVDLERIYLAAKAWRERKEP